MSAMDPFIVDIEIEASPTPEHPFDEIIDRPLFYWRGSFDSAPSAHLIVRSVRSPDGEHGVEIVASCTCIDAAIAAGRLLSGRAYYPLWRAVHSLNPITSETGDNS